MKLKEIPQEFNKNSYTLRLIKRDKNHAIYALYSRGVVTGYELHKVRKIAITCSKFNDSDRKAGYTHIERLASNKDFGNYGWSFDTLQATKDKLDELKTGKKKENKEGDYFY